MHIPRLNMRSKGIYFPYLYNYDPTFIFERDLAVLSFVATGEHARQNPHIVTDPDGEVSFLSYKGNSFNCTNSFKTSLSDFNLIQKQAQFTEAIQLLRQARHTHAGHMEKVKNIVCDFFLEQVAPAYAERLGFTMPV